MWFASVVARWDSPMDYFGSRESREFGNSRAIEGIGSQPGFDIPVTGGNVSLYNETSGSPFIPRRSSALLA